MASKNKDPERVIKTILEETGSMVSPDELRSFIRQAISRGEDLDHALQRCFSDDAPTSADPAERERFRAAAAQLWTREAERFDPQADARIAPLRDDVLVLVKKVADWIRSLDERGIDPTELPAEPMERLGQLSGMLAGVLELLNREDESSGEDLEGLRDTLRGLEPIVVQLIDEADAEIAEGGTDPEGAREPWVGAPPEPESIFILEVSLVGLEPRVWRQIRVPGHYSLGDLHQVLLVLMDWSGGHLHEFVVDERRFADPMDTDDSACEHEELVELDELGLAAGSHFSYLYDFGDSWEHSIRVTRVVAASAFPPPERAAVVCTSGENAAPPEDCGGVPGYSRLVELLARPYDSLDEDEAEFVGAFSGELDPYNFDIDAVNRVFTGAIE